MIKRVIFKIGSINETLFVNQVHIYPRIPRRNQSLLRKQNRGTSLGRNLAFGRKIY